MSLGWCISVDSEHGSWCFNKLSCIIGVQVCEYPMQAFSMAALLVATWRAQLHHDAGEAHVTTSAPPFAVAALSYTLPSLLTHPQWRLAADAMAQRLAAIAEHPVGSVGVHADILVSFCPLLAAKPHFIQQQMRASV